jgi:transitional endoplasmic reticulum ATPase
VTVDELARLTPRCSGADIEAICRRAALLALREWIAPKLNLGRVQVTEAKEDGESQTTTQEQASTAAEDTPAQDQEEEGTARPSTGRFQIRAEHFAQAIDEQRERYAVQEEVEDAQKRQEAGRQRLLEIAADYNSSQKPPLRGFRLWLARLFGLA